MALRVMRPFALRAKPLSRLYRHTPRAGIHKLGVLTPQSRLNLVHISYRGAAPAVADLLGGQIPAAFMTNLNGPLPG